MQSKVQFEISSDRSSLTVTARSDDRQTGTFTATASEIEELIAALAQQRRLMTPEVPKHPAAAQLSGPADPLWAVSRNEGAAGKVLLLRDFGIGWLVFFFPEPSARRLARALLDDEFTGFDSLPGASSRLH